MPECSGFAPAWFVVCQAGAFRCLYTLFNLAWHVQHLPPAQAEAVLRQRGWLQGIRDMANGLAVSFSIVDRGFIAVGFDLPSLSIDVLRSLGRLRYPAGAMRVKGIPLGVAAITGC